MNQQRSITTKFVRILPAFVLAVLGGWPGVGVLADDCPDAWITAKVKTYLLADDGVKAFKINVDTEECVVSLHGCAETKADRRKAGDIARKVNKVRSVQNLLKICPPEKDG